MARQPAPNAPATSRPSPPGWVQQGPAPLRLGWQLWQRQGVRYLFTIGAATLTDTLAYGLLANLGLNDRLTLAQLTPPPDGLRLTGQVAAFVLGYALAFAVNFGLNRWLVFTESTLRGRTQLIRFTLTTGIIMALNLLLLEGWQRLLAGPLLGLDDLAWWFPYVNRLITALTVAPISFVLVRTLSFGLPLKAPPRTPPQG